MIWYFEHQGSLKGIALQTDLVFLRLFSMAWFYYMFWYLGLH